LTRPSNRNEEMPRTDPLPAWTGDVFLIGGGPSLRRFDFQQLRLFPTIGCNQAFLLGPEVCKICIFGDYKFWAHFAQPLSDFAGWVVSPRHTMTKQADWIHFFERQDEGLSKAKLAWNANTGAAAINLALILGASRVFLLGYDCCMDADNSAKPESTHWHDKRIEVPQAQHYDRFLIGFHQVASALPVVFPGRQVFNVSEGGSRIDCFPVVAFESVGLYGAAGIGCK
jgi:hypothetical protein